MMNAVLMKRVIAFLVVILALAAVLPARSSDEPVPVWEWKAADARDRVFDGTRSLAFPEVREKYQPGEGFSVEVRCKPAELDRLAGMVSDYSGSKEGGWYLSTGDAAPFSRPRVVMVTQSADGYRSLQGKVSLKAGQWHTLTLVYDGKHATLYLDDDEVGTLATEEPMTNPSRGAFCIGSRAKSFFKGEIESVRLWAQPIKKVGSPAVVDKEGEIANYIANSSFENGKRLEDVLLWHRMTQTDAGVTQIKGWELDSTVAYHGKRSLKGIGASPLVIMEEVWEKVNPKKPWVFSVYLKADRDGVLCDLSAGAFWRLDEEVVSTEVKLTREWKRYEVIAKGIPRIYRRGTMIQGPVGLTIAPRGDATVWVDAVQWSPKEREYSDHGPEAAAGDAPPVHYPLPATLSRPGGEGSWTGSIPLRVYRANAGSEVRQPVTVSVPFNRSQWDGKGTLTLRDAQGKLLEVQSEVLTAWGGGEGVQVLGLFFTDQLTAGWQDYTLEVTPEASAQPALMAKAKWQMTEPKVPGQLWGAMSDAQGHPLFEAGSLVGVGWDGAIYDSQFDKEAQWKLERSGPLYQVCRGTGRLVDRDGRALLAYVARVHRWRDLPGVKLEISLVNTRQSGSVRVRSLYWQTKEGSEKASLIAGENQTLTKGKLERSVFYSPETASFALRQTGPAGTSEKPGREPLVLKARMGSHTILAHAPEAWQRHPSQLAWEDGQWRGYLWPDTGARGLLFARGLALTREFWIGEAATEDQQVGDGDPVGIAAPGWWAQTDVLIPFFAADPDRFPFMESRLDTRRLLERLGNEKVESIHAYGVFDYGDIHGDGGWANMESFMDWAAILGGLRSGDASALEAGLRGARHYRDVDMNQASGACYVHNLNHVAGGTDMSHAWPGGVVAHYLLTGSKRSQEVALLHGDYLLALDADELAKGLRSLGRYLTNLVDLYQVTGDQRFKDRFFNQVRLSRELLAADKENPDRSIFSYIEHSKERRLVPFHAWYGISALQKMEALTGDPALSAFIAEEIAATLNPELYDFDLQELWPGISPKKGKPMVLANAAQHRGSFFYPVMIAQAIRAGRPDDAALALQSFYCSAVEGRFANRVETILSSAALWGAAAGQKESELVASARALYWEGAAETLLNGDFGQSPDYWHHWRPYPGKSLSYHTNWQERRKKLVSLDGNIHKSGKRSLRLNLLPVAFQGTIKVDTNRFRLEPGHHLLSGWLRWDEGALPPVVSLEVSDLNGNFGVFHVETQSGQIVNKQETIRGGEIRISPPDAQGWREVKIGFSLTGRAVANLLLSATLKERTKEGHLWVDGFKVEAVPALAGE